MKYVIIFILACMAIASGLCADSDGSLQETFGEFIKRDREAEQSYHAKKEEKKAVTLKRPVVWAQPIKCKGVPNLHRVSTNLYRSAQPTAEGMKNLKKMGIETIVNLRSFHSDRDEIGDIDLAYEHIYMKAWDPENKEAIRFLQIMTNTNRLPVLVHCKHGSDRTGTMCAIYRIVVEGWTKPDAIKEMTTGDFGFHEIFQNLPEWIEELDVKALGAGL